MYNSKIRIGQPQASYNVSKTRILKYTVEMFHEGLNEHKLISAPEIEILQNKVNLQANRWTGKWEIIESKRKNMEEREASFEEANLKTQEANDVICEIENILNYALSINNTINWEDLKRFDCYLEEMPSKPIPQSKENYPTEPVKEIPTFSLLEKILKSKKEKKIQNYEQNYLTAIEDWEKIKKTIDESNLKKDNIYKWQIDEWNKEVSNFEGRKSKFLEERNGFNLTIEQIKNNYYQLDENAVIEYCDMVLNNSFYPESFPKDFEVEYNPENKIFIVEYQLPSIECLPKLKEVKYIASKQELKETFLSEQQILKMFDDTVYQITLRTIHELFEADTANALESISFNGWVRAINKATGIEENNCILSIQVKKDDFLKIDLSNVDPKTCFKSLKGVASSKLSSLTPIQPILQLSKVDKRFVESYEVSNQIDNTTNIAAMDWEDFEHLIRELFEKEFQSNGGEVKVTQASRDGGVDAIAFDPDPIRGGKIVIQAKRYTNTVGVSAVRDLYGTVLNEGATKGILVTTADYGSDSYDFAKGKPLTLLNGSNLLHLLEKHGHHAKIDIKEAKKILAENDNK